MMISDWEECYSKSNHRAYWFNRRTNERSWTAPSSSSVDNEVDNVVTANNSGHQLAVETASNSIYAPNKGDVHVADEWFQHFSKSSQRPYWFNRRTNERSWTAPPSTSSSDEQRDRTVTHEGKGDKLDKMDDNSSESKIAIIVPFRDLHVEQTRARHLNMFVPAMLSFLQRSGSSFHIYIIEQSNDKRKFNRGKLLNIGFDLARKEGCGIFIFHDVDLLPSSELLPYYSKLPLKAPIHIAKVWGRYSQNNDKYFGGIVSFSRQMFQDINGFPNNFWGWGGEDDEMFSRITRLGLVPEAPAEGSIEDMEDMNLQQKLAVLKQHKLWQCMNRYELKDEHETSWRSNGLIDLSYELLKRTELDRFCSKVTVDVKLNGHWSDCMCGVDDKQMMPNNKYSSVASNSKKRSLPSSS